MIDFSCERCNQVSNMASNRNRCITWLNWSYLMSVIAFPSFDHPPHAYPLTPSTSHLPFAKTLPAPLLLLLAASTIIQTLFIVYRIIFWHAQRLVLYIHMYVLVQRNANVLSCPFADHMVCCVYFYLLCLTVQTRLGSCEFIEMHWRLKLC